MEEGIEFELAGERKTKAASQRRTPKFEPVDLPVTEPCPEWDVPF